MCTALKAERRRQLEIGIHGLTATTAKPKLFAAAAKAYLLKREAQWEPKTREMHANSLRHLEPHFGNLLLQEIKADHIHRYRGKRSKAGASNRTINIETNLVRLVLRDAKLWNNIADEIKPLKERRDVWPRVVRR